MVAADRRRNKRARQHFASLWLGLVGGHVGEFSMTGKYMLHCGWICVLCVCGPARCGEN